MCKQEQPGILTSLFFQGSFSCKILFESHGTKLKILKSSGCVIYLAQVPFEFQSAFEENILQSGNLSDQNWFNLLIQFKAIIQMTQTQGYMCRRAVNGIP